VVPGETKGTNCGSKRRMVLAVQRVVEESFAKYAVSKDSNQSVFLFCATTNFGFVIY
jgi:hypothetical protein